MSTSRVCCIVQIQSPLKQGQKQEPGQEANLLSREPAKLKRRTNREASLQRIFGQDYVPYEDRPKSPPPGSSHPEPFPETIDRKYKGRGKPSGLVKVEELKRNLEKSTILATSLSQRSQQSSSSAEVVRGNDRQSDFDLSMNTASAKEFDQRRSGVHRVRQDTSARSFTHIRSSATAMEEYLHYIYDGQRDHHRGTTNCKANESLLGSAASSPQIERNAQKREVAMGDVTSGLQDLKLEEPARIQMYTSQDSQVGETKVVSDAPWGMQNLHSIRRAPVDSILDVANGPHLRALRKSDVDDVRHRPKQLGEGSDDALHKQSEEGSDPVNIAATETTKQVRNEFGSPGPGTPGNTSGTSQLKGSESVPKEIVLKNVLRHMPHSVVVITACTPDPSGNPDVQDHYHRAMTVSSFTSVTMGETPVVSFNIKVPSRTFEGIEHWTSFRVHILSNSADGAAIANAFTTGDSDHGFRAITRLSVPASVKAPALSSPNDTLDSFPAPLIQHPSIVATLDCRLMEELTVEIHDHKVVFAAVERVSTPLARRVADQMEPIAPFVGLMYQDRAYKSVGQPQL